jgi:hypothetical protein
VRGSVKQTRSVIAGEDLNVIVQILKKLVGVEMKPARKVGVNNIWSPIAHVAALTREIHIAA